MIQDLQDYLADLQGVEAEYYKSKISLSWVHIGPFGREAIQQAMEQEKQANPIQRTLGEKRNGNLPY
jgi:hypothetical protein